MRSSERWPCHGGGADRSFGIDVRIGGAQNHDDRGNAPALGDAAVGHQLHDGAFGGALRHAGLIEALPQLHALDGLRRVGHRRLAVGPHAAEGQAEVLQLEPPLAAVGQLVGERDAELVRPVGQLGGGIDPLVGRGRGRHAGLVKQVLVVDQREVHIDRRQAVELAILLEIVVAAAGRDAEIGDDPVERLGKLELADHLGGEVRHRHQHVGIDAAGLGLDHHVGDVLAGGPASPLDLILVLRGVEFVEQGVPAVLFAGLELFPAHDLQGDAIIGECAPAERRAGHRCAAEQGSTTEQLAPCRLQR